MKPNGKLSSLVTWRSAVQTFNVDTKFYKPVIRKHAIFMAQKVLPPANSNGVSVCRRHQMCISEQFLLHVLPVLHTTVQHSTGTCVKFGKIEKNQCDRSSLNDGQLFVTKNSLCCQNTKLTCTVLTCIYAHSTVYLL